MSEPPNTILSKCARAETESHGSDVQSLPSGTALKPPPKCLKDATLSSSDDDSPEEFAGARSDGDPDNEDGLGTPTEEGDANGPEDGVDKLARTLAKQGSSGPLTATEKRSRYTANYANKTPEEALDTHASVSTFMYGADVPIIVLLSKKSHLSYYEHFQKPVIVTVEKNGLPMTMHKFVCKR